MKLSNAAHHAPEIILGASVAAGVAGFADSAANMYYGVDLGIRNFLPEPIDLPDHGMSMAMGGLFSYIHWIRPSKRFLVPSIDEALNPDTTPVSRGKALTIIKAVAGTAMAAGIMHGSLYVGVGEVGSEVLHYANNRAQESSPEGKRESLPLGRFDPLDIALGVGVATCVSRGLRKRFDTIAAEIEAEMPTAYPRAQVIPITRPTGHQAPQANKRYTPPQKKKR